MDRADTARVSQASCHWLARYWLAWCWRDASDGRGRFSSAGQARARYLRDVVEPRETLQILLELTRHLTDERSLPAALKLVTDAALRMLPGDHASIRVLDRSGAELLSGARSGKGHGKKPVKHVPGYGVAGWVVEHGKVARINDTKSDDRFIHKDNQGFDIRSMLAVPLWSAGEVVGVLATTSELPDGFDAEHEELVSLLANCAVPPIEKARLARLAVTDVQTLTFNHAYLMPGLREQMESHRVAQSSLSVLLIDLDHFKKVNDAHGHAAGDLVLREFADRARSTTRDNDVVVRRGGDEFVLIMPGTDRHSARIAAERLRMTMGGKAVALADGAQVLQTVSVGIATWDGKETAEQLEKRADDAMYEAKLSGRNRICYAPSGAAERIVEPPAEQPTAKTLAADQSTAEKEE